jgi:hypothetical protein
MITHNECQTQNWKKPELSRPKKDVRRNKADERLNLKAVQDQIQKQTECSQMHPIIKAKWVLTEKFMKSIAFPQIIFIFLLQACRDNFTADTKTFSTQKASSIIGAW